MPWRQRRRSHRTTVLGKKFRTRSLVIGLAVVLAGCAGAAYVVKHKDPNVDVPVNDEPKITTPPGETTRGAPSVYVDNVRVEPNFVPMDPRQMCAWGNPGANPWRGDNYSALLAMNIPAPTARNLAALIAAKSATSIAYVSNSSIWADNGQAFSPFMAMTFGNSLCYGTRANFKDVSRVEAGELYVRDGFYVWVPRICGNITRLIPLAEAEANKDLVFPRGTFGTPATRPFFGVPTPWSQPAPAPRPMPGGVVVGPNYPELYALIPGVPQRGQPYAPMIPGSQGPRPRRPRPGGGETGGNQVPLPDTAWLLLAGSAALFITRRRLC